MPVSDAPARAHAARPQPARSFGRFELRQLLGRSQRTMLWLGFDPHSEQELLITLPRVAPVGAPALERWLAKARQGSRLGHPHLAHVVEAGVQDRWPYIACDRALGLTIGEVLAGAKPPSHNDAMGWLCQALEGLAFAHEAGVAHHDLQLHNLLLDEHGHIRVMALAVASESDASDGASPHPAGVQGRGMPLDPAGLHGQREAAERDVLAIGILAHQLISGVAPLDEPDTARVVEQLPPHGNMSLRLPWSAAQPIPEALRAIVNRTTEAQPRQRYHNARTLLRALAGWREADAQASGGPLATLLDRLHSIGHLPALPRISAMVVRLTRMERERVNEMAEQILLDMGLSFELLRQVNSAQVQGMQVSGSGPVLTIRRAIAMLGLDGVRAAASALRPWPGPLTPDGAAAMQRLMHRVRLAGHVAQLLRPRGYDPEVIFLIAIMQNLGRLMVQYHFADDAEQIWQLMRPVPPATADAPEQPGMSEEAAAYAVLGTDIAAMTNAVARHFGMADEVLHMIRRLPLDKPVRTPDGDNDLLRIAASAANEVVDAVSQLPPQRVGQAIEAIAKRYTRVLGINARDVTDALQIARQMLANGGHPVSSAGDEREARTEHAPLDLDLPLAADGTPP